MVSISNNHINDYGLEGHEDTRKALDVANVKWGEEGKIVYFEKHNFKIAVICVSMYGDYVLPTIQSALKKRRRKVTIRLFISTVELKVFTNLKAGRLTPVIL